MAENTFENNNVESSNEEFRKNKNFQRNRFTGRRNRFGNYQKKFDSPNENQNQMTGENQEEGTENDQKRPYGKPFADRCEYGISLLSFNPTLELPPYDPTEKKFGGRNRIYIGNTGNEITEEDLQPLFQPYGEVSEIFINKEKCFAFVKMDYHVNAVKARRELDGVTVKSKMLRMKISPSTAIVKVKNLVHCVTNELLYYAFSPFGEIENVSVIVDERGRPSGEGIIDFTRKGSAQLAIQKCQDKCYFLSASLKPVVVEHYEMIDQTVGLLDKHFSKRNFEFSQERSVGPRLAEVGSFEHEYGTRWKSLFDLFKKREEALRVEFRLECEKLEAQMEYARYEHETEALRNQLRAREMDKERQKREWEAKERQAEEEKLRAEAHIRQTQEDIQNRLMRQHEDMRRRQEEEANLLLQAQNLTSILDTQEHLECEAPSSSTTREMSMGALDSYNKGAQNNNSLLGTHPGSEQFESAWTRPNMDGRWVREDNRERGGYQQPKKRRF